MPKLVLFCHSLRSDWNHGNAHFLRGILDRVAAARLLGGGLGAGGCVERAQSRGRAGRGGARCLARGLSRSAGHGLRPGGARPRPGARWRGSGAWCTNGARPIWSRASRPTAGPAGAICCCSTTRTTGWRPIPRRSPRFDLDGFDGVLAFGEVLREAYRRRGWGRQVFTWHEAADLSVFRPHPGNPARSAISSGSAIGATRSAPRNCPNF